MNSRTAINFLKATGKDRFMINGHIRQMLRSGVGGQRITVFQDEYPRPGNDYQGQHTDIKDSRTDYTPKPKAYDKIPMKAKARAATSAQDRPAVPAVTSAPSSARNIGNTIWRRYPNGDLDVRYAISKLRESLRKYKTGMPVNETDALRISSVFPDITFDNLPKEMVNIKAFLNGQERRGMVDLNQKLEEEESLRAIVDLGGA